MCFRRLGASYQARRRKRQRDNERAKAAAAGGYGAGHSVDHGHSHASLSYFYASVGTGSLPGTDGQSHSDQVLDPPHHHLLVLSTMPPLLFRHSHRHSSSHRTNFPFPVIVLIVFSLLTPPASQVSLSTSPPTSLPTAHPPTADTSGSTTSPSPHTVPPPLPPFHRAARTLDCACRAPTRSSQEGSSSALPTPSSTNRKRSICTPTHARAPTHAATHAAIHAAMHTRTCRGVSGAYPS